MYSYNFPLVHLSNLNELKIKDPHLKLSKTQMSWMGFFFREAHLSAFQTWTPENKTELITFQISLPTANICQSSLSSTCCPLLHCPQWTGCPRWGKMSGAWQCRTFPSRIPKSPRPLCFRKLQLRQSVCACVCVRVYVSSHTHEVWI